jgi:hypothetical protein
MIPSIISLLFGCSASALQEGGLYATRQDDGSYSILKILKIDPQGVHVRLYSNKFSTLPKNIDESKLYMAGIDRKPGETLGMGHAPISKQSFSSWKAQFIQPSKVNPEELEGYNMWLEAKGGYF